MSNKTEAGKPLFLRIRSVATIGAVVLKDTGAVSRLSSRDMVSSDFGAVVLFKAWR